MDDDFTVAIKEEDAPLNTHARVSRVYANSWLLRIDRACTVAIRGYSSSSSKTAAALLEKNSASGPGYNACRLRSKFAPTAHLRKGESQDCQCHRWGHDLNTK